MQEIRERGINLKSYSVGDHKTTCPECSHTRRNKTDRCLSVTIESDDGVVWNSHHCGSSGGIAGRAFKSDRERVNFSKAQEPKSVYTAIPALPTTGLTDNIYQWFQIKRGISRETVDAFGIIRTSKYFGDGEVPCIGFPYVENGETVNIKYRSNKKGFRQEKGAKKTLYNIDRVENEKTIIFVEGEMDVLACYEAGFTNAVSLPDGAPKEARYQEGDKRFAAIANCADALEDKDHIIIAVDNDEAGNALKLELAHRFGKDRCSVVDWPISNSECKDANDVLLKFGPDALIDCIKNSTAFPVEGVYSVRDYRQEVLNIYSGNIQRPISTGFPNLDEYYQVMSGTFALVTGIPNHGKSNFLDHLAINLMKKHDWKFAVFSPEHSTPNHIRRLSEKIVEKPFDVGPNVRMSKEELTQAMDALDEYFYFMESEDQIPSIDWLLSKCKSAVLRFGCRGIIIDPYNEIDATRGEGKREDEHIRDLISKCKSFCRSHNVSMWMVAHPAKMRRDETGAYPPPSLYDVSGSAHWNNMADVGLVVHRDFEEGNTSVITRKIREQGLYGSIGQAFFTYSISKHIYEPLMDTQVDASRSNYHWTQD